MPDSNYNGIMNRSAEETIITPSFMVLRQCNQALFKSTDEYEYMDRVCHILVAAGGYDGALIWFQKNNTAKTFTGSITAYAGFSERVARELEQYIFQQSKSDIIGSFEKNTAIVCNTKSQIEELLKDSGKIDALFPSLSSLLLIPLHSNHAFLGFFSVGSRRESAFSPQAEEFLTEISVELAYGIQTIRSEKQRKLTEQALKERMRELRGLFALNTLADSNKPVPEVISEFVNVVLPNSMHDPEKTIATIELDGETYTNCPDKKKNTVPYLSLPLVINAKTRGVLSVSHTIGGPKGGAKDAFESKLIYAYADKLSKYLSRLEATAGLSEREEQMRRILDSLPDMIFQLDEDLRIIWANRKALELNSGVLGKHCYEAYLGRKKICANCPSLSALKTGEVKKGSVYFAETEDPRGETLWENIGVPLKDFAGKTIGVIEISRDVTDHMKAQENLRNLSTHLQTVREEERTAISREIHDELGQSLTALKMDLYWLNKHLPDDHEKMKKKSTAMLEIIDDTVSAVQRIMSQLRPMLLDDLDLGAAIEWEIEDFKNRTGIPYSLEIDEKIKQLNKGPATSLFRIFQEALTNVARHSEASNVAVTVSVEEDKVSLCIIDNGKGIEETSIFGNKSYGLLGMRERALSWGGEVKIRRREEGGTVVCAVIPRKVRNRPS